MHAKFEEPQIVLEKSDVNTHEIVQFIKDNEAGLVGQMKPSNDEIFKKPAVVVYFEIDWKRNPKVSIL